MNVQTILSLQVLKALARAGGKLSIREAARRANLGISYTGNILQELRDAGVVTSTRGSKGGYELAKAPDRLSVHEVVVRLESGILPDADGDTPQTKAIRLALRGPIGESLKTLTIADL